MPEIRRIEKLKNQALFQLNKIKAENPLQLFDSKYVSKSGLTYTDLSERIDRLSDCSTIMEMKSGWTWDNENCVEQVLTVTAANYCKQPHICPVCADRMQSRRRVRYNDPIRNQVKMVSTKKRIPYFITYTINDGPDLSERLEHLKDSIRSFRLMGQKRDNGNSKGEAGKIKAAISTIEIKRGANSGEWHVHAHQLAFCDEPLDYEVYDQVQKGKLYKKFNGSIPKDDLAAIAKKKVMFRGEMVAASKLSAEWLHASGDSMGIAIDRISHAPRARTVIRNGILKKKSLPEKKRNKLLSMSFEDSLCYQSIEAMKYPCKTSDNTPMDTLEVIEHTYNKRMVATYGEFRGVAGDDYIEETGTDEETFVLTWNDRKREYDEPKPGKLRDIKQELEHDVRSKCGRLTGQYRRERRTLILNRDRYGDDLYRLLDVSKEKYRATVRSLWVAFQNSVQCALRAKNANCDKYSPLMAAAGAFIPGSDTRDIYQAAFT